MSFLSKYHTCQDLGSSMGKIQVHRNTPYLVRMSMDLYKFWMKVWNKYILCFAHARFFSQAEFRGIISVEI